MENRLYIYRFNERCYQIQSSYSIFYYIMGTAWIVSMSEPHCNDALNKNLPNQPNKGKYAESGQQSFGARLIFMK